MKKGIFFSFILTALLLSSCGNKVTQTAPNVADTPANVADAVADDTEDMEETEEDMMDDDHSDSDDMDGDDAMEDSDDMDESDDMDGSDENMEDADGSESTDSIEATLDVSVDTDAGSAELKTAGSFAPYTQDAVANADGKVILAFHADWCSSCVAARKNFQENGSEIPADVTVLEVNYDDAQALKEKYNVTSQHTYVQVDSAGELLKKWKGGSTVAEITGQAQ